LLKRRVQKARERLYNETADNGVQADLPSLVYFSTLCHCVLCISTRGAKAGGNTQQLCLFIFLEKNYLQSTCNQFGFNFPSFDSSDIDGT